jgi:hypothetical protein
LPQKLPKIKEKKKEPCPHAALPKVILLKINQMIRNWKLVGFE